MLVLLFICVEKQLGIEVDDFIQNRYMYQARVVHRASLSVDLSFDLHTYLYLPQF